MTLDKHRLPDLMALANLLHSLLSIYPEKASIDEFKANELALCWPKLDHSAKEQQALDALHHFLDNWRGTEQQLIELKLDFGELFYGPHTPKAPPWGSVYTGPSQLLNDQSTLELSAFLRQHGIEVHQQSNEPLDHIATILAVISYLLESLAQPGSSDTTHKILTELLETHLLPWSGRFTELAAEHAKTDFYRSVSLLCEIYLLYLSGAVHAEAKPVSLYL
ncbi:molecular chaperone TorD family protein [Ferrimonas sp. YFM]|uniref:TorD/DmsD family molecular chaperone n=1 Tax=Ferrimonas sp. YFM TaxID=3028878 RepID=UPI002573055C|nr:molecular chaperone TorD family protein [Ferrimonas sp. YFM]BDY04568.1 molecular chaperone TorD [Ferrimonas sp. YFM]